MAVQTTANLTNSQRVQYLEKYAEGAKQERLYDMFAMAPPGMPMGELQHGSSVSIPFVSEMSPGTDTVSETDDIIPQTRRDATVSITPTSRGEALQWSLQNQIQAYTDFVPSCYKTLGMNQMESVDLLAQAAVLQGNLRFGAARSVLDAGTTADNLSYAVFETVATVLEELRCPAIINSENGSKSWMAAMRGEPYYDVRIANPVLDVGKYQKGEIILQNELGKLGSFKIVRSAFAKVFGAAGAANGTPVSTTVNGDAKALDKTFVTAADVSANIAKGRVWLVGPAAETGNTFQPTNEIIRPSSAVTTTITFTGQGANGGFRFDHPTGHVVKNADSVYPVAFGSPYSLYKIWSGELGEYGRVTDKIVGLADQFISLAWYWIGNYGRVSESWIARAEVSSSLDNV